MLEFANYGKCTVHWRRADYTNSYFDGDDGGLIAVENIFNQNHRSEPHGGKLQHSLRAVNRQNLTDRIRVHGHDIYFFNLIHDHVHQS